MSPSASSGPLGRPSTSQFGGNTYENRQPVTNELDSIVPLPASKPRSPVMNVVRIVIPLVAAVGGFYLGWRLFAGGISLPEEVAGIPRLEDAASTQVTDLLDEAFTRLGVDAKAGLYGEPNAAGPSVLLVVVDDAPPADPDLQFSQFAAALTQSGHGTDRSGRHPAPRLRRRGVPVRPHNTPCRPCACGSSTTGWASWLRTTGIWAGRVPDHGRRPERHLGLDRPAQVPGADRPTT